MSGSAVQGNAQQRPQHIHSSWGNAACRRRWRRGQVRVVDALLLKAASRAHWPTALVAPTLVHCSCSCTSSVFSNTSSTSPPAPPRLNHCSIPLHDTSCGSATPYSSSRSSHQNMHSPSNYNLHHFDANGMPQCFTKLPPMSDVAFAVCVALSSPPAAMSFRRGNISGQTRRLNSAATHADTANPIYVEKSRPDHRPAIMIGCRGNIAGHKCHHKQVIGGAAVQLVGLLYHLTTTMHHAACSIPQPGSSTQLLDTIMHYMV
jgi:hypothetical protein